MLSAQLRASRNLVIMPWLAGELENEIPDLDIHGSEKRLLEFAYQDLETCLSEKFRDTTSEDIEEVVNDETRQDEVKSFLKVWTKQWLVKWRERVTFCQKIPHFSLDHLKMKKKATKIFKTMKKGQELKELVVQKLINNGEICMADLISENMIIEEITSRLRMNKGKAASEKKVTLEPWNILQEVLPRVTRLTERKTPLIHLKLITEL